MTTIQLLATEIDQRAKSVLLQRDKSAAPPERPGAAVWRADYALLLLWPTGAEAPAALNAELAEARSHLEKLMIDAERDNRGLIDGYLLAALEKPPSPEMLPEIQRQELSPFICRTHLVWPNDEGWPRLKRVALLAPATAPGDASTAVLPDGLDQTDMALLERLENEPATTISGDILRRVGLS
jgi:hypothetical protein